MSPQDEELPTITCLRCDHTWTKRIKKPRICPACNSYKFDIPKEDKS